MKARIGIDCGSTACKGVLLIEGTLAFSCIKPTGWNPKESARLVMEELLKNAELCREDVGVVATGYGRVGIDFSDRTVTEITCHALGAGYLLPDVRTVIDIGGQDSKVIAVKDSRVVSFQMNDKCAAGTGRFLEMSAHRMGVDVSEFSTFLKAEKSCSISSMCVVFADSEIISLMADGKTREEIAGGIVKAVASRAAALAARIEVCPKVLLTGGLSGLEGIRKSLENQLNIPIETSIYSQYAGAIGAALTKL